MAEIAKAKEDKKDDVRKEGDEKTSGRKTLMSRFRNMKGLVAGLALLTSMSLTAAQGCGSDEGNGVVPLPDAGLDAGDSDTTTDSGDTDTGTDTDSGTITDGGIETDSGPDLDGGDTDSGTDSGTDPDAGPVACGSASNGSTTTTLFYMNTPKAVGGYNLTVTGQAPDGIYMDVDCGADSASIVVDTNCLESSPTTISIPTDGKQIEVHVLGSNSSAASLTVFITDSP